MSATASLKQRAAKWSIGASVLLILAGFLDITIPRTAGVAASKLAAVSEREAEHLMARPD